MQEMGKLYELPNNLLQAIAFVESGYSNKTGASFPWTINVEGKSYLFQTKQEAISAIRAFQKQGHRSIDVGLMQINLKYHVNAFKSLDQALDPTSNIKYAAKYLRGLYQQHGNWRSAIRHYHSANPKFNRIYLSRVLTVFEETGVCDKLPVTMANEMRRTFDYHIKDHFVPITVHLIPVKGRVKPRSLIKSTMKKNEIRQTIRKISLSHTKAR